jgi:hypothetical protein
MRAILLEPNYLKGRVFNIAIVDENTGDGIGESKLMKSIVYKGKPLMIKM